MLKKSKFYSMREIVYLLAASSQMEPLSRTVPQPNRNIKPYETSVERERKKNYVKITVNNGL